MAVPLPKPDVGDLLVAIHDFEARSSDELSLSKGDRVELIERDDEFGDGWFLGKHLSNGNSGLFPEVYTRLAPSDTIAPKSLFSPANTPAVPPSSVISPPDPITTSPPAVEEPKPVDIPLPIVPETQKAAPAPVPAPLPVTGPLSPSKTNSLPAGSSIPSFSATSPVASPGPTKPGRVTSAQDSRVLNETLDVINEHITDLRSAPSNGLTVATGDSGSEYSSHFDRRMSYIQGEETDEEEESTHTRTEVESWSADDVAEYLFTAGVEKHHCEVFRDQEITGEVLLGMDQTSLFIKAFDLGSVGRRLKTWHKIQSLQNEVKGIAKRRTTQTYGSDAGSDDAKKARSRTNTLTSSQAGGQKLPAVDDQPQSGQQTKRTSAAQTPKVGPTPSGVPPVSPISPTAAIPESPSRPFHEKRPSAASVRELHHSRRHSSNDFRLTGTTLNTSTTPKLVTSGTFPQPEQPTTHKKQPSFDRNWTLGSAAAAYSPRPLSSAGFHQDGLSASNPDLQDSAVDLDRGYFSGTEVDGRRRNVLRKRDSTQPGGHSAKSSYADEQRMRSATAASRHSRFGSVDSARDMGPPSAAQKYYGITGTVPHRRNTSTATTESIRPVLPPKDVPPPTVTRLETTISEPSPRSATVSPLSPPNRQGMHQDWFAKPALKAPPAFGVRAISDAVTGNERSNLGSMLDSPSKDSPLQSPSRTGSSTPSAGPSFELDSPDAKSPSTTTTVASRNARKPKSKKETSAYLRGLQKISPREAMMDADYSGWMKKKSSNLMTTWKSRLFVLKGRRLAYYYSENDDQEKGLIDISFHRVLPADNERLTGLHATLTGASTTPAVPLGNHVPTLAEVQASADPTQESAAMFIFKLVPPRTGLSRAVNFTKPTVHYFAVPNIKQGRLWMAALMKATIDRDDSKAITTTYQQKTITLAKARAMRHRPPALMNLDEKGEELLPEDGGENENKKKAQHQLVDRKDAHNGLGIVYDEAALASLGELTDLEKLGLQKVESARARAFTFDTESHASLPQSA